MVYMITNLFNKKYFATNNIKENFSTAGFNYEFHKDLQKDCFVSFNGRRKLDLPEEIIRQERREGKKISELAKEYGCSKITIQNVLLNKRKLKGYADRICQITEQAQSELCREYLEGKTLLDLAIKYNSSNGVIKKILSKNGIQTRQTVKVRTFSKEEEEKICQEYISGATMTELAQSYNFSVFGIRNILVRNSVQRRDTGTAGKFSQEEQNIICEEYKDNKSLQILADEYNSSSTTIRNILLAHGITINKAGGMAKLSEQLHAEICEGYRNGKTLQILATEYDCSPSTIKKVLSLNENPIRSRGSKKLSEEEKDEIKRAFANGSTLLMLANKYNCSVNSINIALFQRGVLQHCPTKNYKISKKAQKDICEAYKSGRTMTELANQYDCTVNSIRNILRKNNILLRKAGGIFKFSEYEQEQICRKYEQGASTVDLAKDYNCAKNSIRNVLIRKGIQLRSKFGFKQPKESESR